MYKVRATELNLRSAPRVAPSNRIGLLARGHEVELLEKVNAHWWRVRTQLSGVEVTGYVAAAYLVEAEALPALAAADDLVPVHLFSQGPVKRSVAAQRAFALNEPDQPRRAADSPNERARQLIAIVQWLRVDQSARYLPKGSTTYCNIYAYDYCYLGNAYLPRVWWSAKAINALLKGERVEAVYGKTVYELNANSLHRWFEEFGGRFGWRRTVDLTSLQDAANAGAVCIISGQRVDVNTPGHICAVVPEHDANQATRTPAGQVKIPLQSNAGARNFQFGGKVWWTAAKFKSFSFWICE